MRSIVTTLTSLLFTWQVLIGCCAHHAHVCAHDDSIHTGCHHEDGHAVVEHCAHDNPAHEPSPDPDDRPPCSCGQCRSIYVKANVTRIDPGELLAMGAALAPPADARASINLRALRRELLGPIQRSGPPLPLLHCALLL